MENFGVSRQQIHWKKSLWNNAIFPQNRFMEILSYPLKERCYQLGLLIEHCSIKELQEVFPTLVNSIFRSNNGIGWGLRSYVANISTYEFNILYDFFIPLGPMFRLCYKLLNDALKFDVPITTLPIKMRQMLESGRYPLFYSDMINVDHFTRQVTSVSFSKFPVKSLRGFQE